MSFVDIFFAQVFKSNYLIIFWYLMHKNSIKFHIKFLFLLKVKKKSISTHQVSSATCGVEKVYISREIILTFTHEILR